MSKKRDLYVKFHSSLIHNKKKTPKITQMFIWWLDKQMVQYTYNTTQETNE